MNLTRVFMTVFLFGTALTATAQALPTRSHVIDWKPDGTEYAASTELGVWIFDADGLPLFQVVSTLEGSSTDIAWNTDGSRLAVSGWQSPIAVIQIWETVNYNLLLTIEIERAEFLPIAWNSDSSLIAGSNGREVQVWDTSSGAEVALLEEHHQGVTAVEWGPSDSWLMTTDGFGVVRLWDISTATATASFSQDRAILSAVLNPDGSMVATTYADQVKVWDTSTSQEIASLQGHTGPVRVLSWSSAGFLASASRDNTIKIWDVVNQELLNTIDTSAPIFYLDWTPDGSRLSYGYGNPADSGPIVIIEDPTLSSDLCSDNDRGDSGLLDNRE